MANSVDRIITHTTCIMSLTDNLGSNLTRVAQLIYNMKMNLLSDIFDNRRVAPTPVKVEPRTMTVAELRELFVGQL